ncbi:uncharacterized protein ACA1_149980 [Acanthamoeba castellanii str. Neff]|uniref:Telomeric single stranded DNA binding POT1/Cdc13 domain-containing protein n=1 Tax=Acanthamoeba castellanii (strain ATCC 30010 / Neff) TaxID=1257118 RepID=L8HDH1_ACACF|nr:uncharacterized protein ACA1_149980 [Acanthamoeba castellanii str. Neff]ELR22808.1 hypothetical protein ACA1_149980 [Acanthamoeba castellanii str. Neff]
MKRTREELSCDALTQVRRQRRVEENEDEDEELEEEPEEAEDGVQVSRLKPPLPRFTSARQFVRVEKKPEGAAPTAATAKKTAPPAEYTYTRISELQPGQQANVYGVVRALKEPRPTRGTDWVVALVVVDVSAPTKEEGLGINLFAPEERAWAVTTSTPYDKALAHHARESHSRGFAWILVDGAPGAPLVPHSSSSERATFTSKDEERIKSIRVWASSTALIPTTTATATTTTTTTTTTATTAAIPPGASSTRAALESPYVRRIARVEENAWFDLICQITEIRDDSVRSLLVWDGTKAPLDVSGLSETGQPQALEGLSSRLRVVADMPPPVMHRLLAVPLGTWVHLRNVKGHKHANGYMYCAARMKSSFEVLPPTDPRVEALLQGFEEKKRAFLSDDEARSLRKPKDEAHAESVEEPAQLAAIQKRPAPPVLPPTPPTVIVRCADLPLSTIDEILSYPESTALFRCQAHVRGMVPEQVEAITRPSSVKPDAPHVYLFQLQLQDPTGTLDAYVYDREGALFLGLDAVDLEENSCTRESIRAKMEALLAHPTPADFVIRAYHLDSSRPSLRRYQITSTIINVASAPPPP